MYLTNSVTAICVCVSNVVFVFQSVVHVEVRVLPAGLPGCASASPRPLSVTWGGHLLEPHQHQFQQQRLENTIRSRWEIGLWCETICILYLISAFTT